MARYDTALAEERGAVRAGQYRDPSDDRVGYGYNRGFDPRENTAWQRPDQMRGYRGGSAGSYGAGNDYGNDYGRDYGGRGRNWHTGSTDYGSLYGANYNGGRFGRNFYGGRYGADYYGRLNYSDRGDIDRGYTGNRYRDRGGNVGGYGAYPTGGYYEPDRYDIAYRNFRQSP